MDAMTEAEEHVYGNGTCLPECFNPDCEYASEHRDGDEMFCPHHGWSIGTPCLAGGRD